MPFTQIFLLRGKPPAYLQAVSDGLHQALVEAFEVPPDDRFQAIHQHEPGELVFDRCYLGGPRSDTKRAFYRRLVERLAESPGIAAHDVMIVVGTTGAQDWSFSDGRMTMIDGARPC
jgi:hypothetical protein